MDKLNFCDCWLKVIIYLTVYETYMEVSSLKTPYYYTGKPKTKGLNSHVSWKPQHGVPGLAGQLLWWTTLHPLHPSWTGLSQKDACPLQCLAREWGLFNMEDTKKAKMMGLMTTLKTPIFFWRINKVHSRQMWVLKLFGFSFKYSSTLIRKSKMKHILNKGSSFGCKWQEGSWTVI